MKKTILLIGTLPPPIGGVTIHLQRFFNLNRNNESFKFFLLDIKKKCVFSDKGKSRLSNLIKVLFSADIIHIHISNNFKLIFAFLGKIFFKKVIYTHHNSRIKNKLFFKVFIRLCDYLIFVNESFVEKNKRFLTKTSYEVIPAFIEPTNLEELPKEILNEIKESKFTIASNCAIDIYFEKKLMYGFDLLINAFINLARTHKITDSLLILVDPSENLKTIINDYLINYEPINNCKILYVPEKIDFSSLIIQTDLTVRATRTDGDSLTVREALFFKKPIIASDCVTRPNGTITFENENNDDLSKKIEHVYNNDHVIENSSYNFNEPVLKIYNLCQNKLNYEKK